jgi:hypothetical protein
MTISNYQLTIWANAKEYSREMSIQYRNQSKKRTWLIPFGLFSASFLTLSHQVAAQIKKD